MSRKISDKRDCSSSDRSARTDFGRSPQHTRSDEDRFLNGARRFKHPSEIQKSAAIAGINYAGADLGVPVDSSERRSGSDRRSGGKRRCGIDTRSDVERFLQGERRSGIDRRSGRDRRYRSFKKARAFARDLCLKSEGEWYDYVNSGMKPRDIPGEPHQVYVTDGWAGWGDWLGASAVSQQLSRVLRTLRMKRNSRPGISSNGLDR